MNREELEAARASVVGKVDADASEAELTSLIGSLAARSSPQQATFDPQPLRLYAVDLAQKPETLERAKRLAQALTAALPDQGFNWSARAFVSAKARNKGDVIESATHAVDLGVTKSSQLFKLRADAYMDKGDATRARADLDRAIAAEPAVAESLKAHIAEAQLAIDAIAFVERIRKDLLDGSSDASRLVRRWASFDLSDSDLADATVGKRLLAIEMNWSIRVCYAVAEHAYSAKERGEVLLALRVFQALAILNTKDGYMQSMVGACEWQLGHRTAALAGYDAAIAINTRDIMSHTNRGEIHMRAGAFRTAIFDFAASIAMDPNGQSTFANRARVLSRAIADELPSLRNLAERACGALQLHENLERERRIEATKLREELATANSVVDGIETMVTSGAAESDVVARIKEQASAESPGSPHYVGDLLEERARKAGVPHGVKIVRLWTSALSQDARAWSVRARVALDVGDHADVVLSSSRALLLGGDSKVLRFMRGWSLMFRGNPEASLIDFDQILASSDLAPSLRVDVEPRRKEVATSVAARKIATDLRPGLDSGSVKPANLVRAWSSIPLSALDIEEARTGKRQLLEELDWAPGITCHFVTMLAVAWHNEGSTRAARALIEATQLVDKTDEGVQSIAAQIEKASAEAPSEQPVASEGARAFELEAAQRRQFREALVDAFESFHALRQMTLDQLDANLAAITSPNNGLAQVCDELIDWARARGLLRRLIMAARAERPENPKLVTFVDSLKLDKTVGAN